MGAMVEPVLLTLLKETPQHGYNFLNSLENLGMMPPHPSVIYRTLREMEALHWIASDWDSDSSLGPPRRIYSLTQQGRTALQNWQIEMQTTRDLIDKIMDRLK
jgi:PadR family transcriptional regulator PadR